MVEEINNSDLRSALEELLELNRANGSSITVDESNSAKLLMLHGLVAHTLSMAKAGLILIDSKQLQAAMVLARVALEHSVFAQWGYLHERALEGLQANTTITYGRLFNGISKEIPLSPEIQKFYEDEMQKPETFPGEIENFERICNAFVGGESIYAVFRILSGSVHVGNDTHREYRNYDPENNIVTLSWQAQNFDPAPALDALTLAVILVTGIYEDIRQGRPNEKRVRDIAEKVNKFPFLTLRAVTNPTDSIAP